MKGKEPREDPGRGESTHVAVLTVDRGKLKMGSPLRPDEDGDGGKEVEAPWRCDGPPAVGGNERLEAYSC